MDRQQEMQKGGPGRSGRRLLGVGVSVAAHLVVLALLLRAVVTPPEDVQPPPPPTVLLAEGPQAPQPSVSPSPARPAPPKEPARAQTRPAAARSAPPKSTRPAEAPRAEPDDGDQGQSFAPVLSGADLAGAASAEAGGGGGPCNMAQRLQAELRKDPLVRAAVGSARLAPGSEGKPLLVWNGDWVQSGGEEGKGLAAVREAIMWTVGFAPPACRAEPVRGFILLSLSPGTRVALGTGRWRWSDLLASRAAPSS
jgi:hypothetical protein